MKKIEGEKMHLMDDAARGLNDCCQEFLPSPRQKMDWRRRMS